MLNDEIMKQLIEYAHERMEQKNVYPYCAFVVKDETIISKGYNDGLNNWGDRTTHGEMVAIRKACKSLNSIGSISLEGCILFTTCEPCLACFDTALWANIGGIIYSVDHHDFPEYFNDHTYTIDDYVKENPGHITVNKKVLHKDGLALFQKAKIKYGW